MRYDDGLHKPATPEWHKASCNNLGTSEHRAYAKSEWGPDV